VASVVVGCSGATSDASHAGTGSSAYDGDVDASDIDASYVTAQPPSASGSATRVRTRHAFAIHHLHLGEESAPSDDTPLAPNLGYDIDHKNTTASSTDVCTLATNAPRANQADGPGGIDNAFGTAVVPLLDVVVANPSALQDTALAAGEFTLMLDVTGLDESQPTQNATGLSGQIFGGAPFNQAPNSSASAPTFTTADNWPLDPSFLANDASSELTSSDVFAAPYVADGTFVGSVGHEVTLTLLLNGGVLPLRIQHATVTFVSQGTHAGSGILAGVILTRDLVSATQAYAAERCASAFVTQDFVSLVEQAADILHDGTNRAGVPCDAISVGIGFDADEIGAPTVVGEPATYPAPCGEDGGVDDGG
jgi:hypothetical protein